MPIVASSPLFNYVEHCYFAYLFLLHTLSLDSEFLKTDLFYTMRIVVCLVILPWREA